MTKLNLSYEDCMNLTNIDKKRYISYYEKEIENQNKQFEGENK